MSSGCSEEMSDCEQIAQVPHFWAKNQRFAWKTNEGIPSPECRVGWDDSQVHISNEKGATNPSGVK